MQSLWLIDRHRRTDIDAARTDRQTRTKRQTDRQRHCCTGDTDTDQETNRETGTDRCIRGHKERAAPYKQRGGQSDSDKDSSVRGT